MCVCARIEFQVDFDRYSDIQIFIIVFTQSFYRTGNEAQIWTKRLDFGTRKESQGLENRKEQRTQKMQHRFKLQMAMCWRYNVRILKGEHRFANGHQMAASKSGAGLPMIHMVPSYQAPPTPPHHKINQTRQYT